MATMTPPTDQADFQDSESAEAAGMTDPNEAAEGEDQAADNGFDVCIHKGPDGKLMVGVVKAYPPEEYADFKPAADNKAALTLALQALKSDGDLGPDPAAMTAGFEAGYKED